MFGSDFEKTMLKIIQNKVLIIQNKFNCTKISRNTKLILIEQRRFHSDFIYDKSDFN